MRITAARGIFVIFEVFFLVNRARTGPRIFLVSQSLKRGNNIDLLC